MSQFRPLGSNVLIQPDSPDEATPGGIFIASKKTPNTGVVLAVSDDYSFDVCVGDRVRYLPNTRLENDDGTIFLKEDAILFVING